MKKDSRWISMAGVGALALITIAGCAGKDTTGDGQAADSPAASQAQTGVDKMQEGAKEVGNAAANGAVKSGETVVNAASNAGNAVANTAVKAGNAVANTAVKAGNAVANTAVKAGDATVVAANKAVASTKNLDDALKVTPLIKTAIGANAALKGSNINVDTTDKSVSLTGTVKSDAQKTLAGKIAATNASGYTIKNDLKVVK